MGSDAGAVGEHIFDPDDPRVAELRHLNDASHRRRVEAPTSFAPGSFVVEGWLPLERAIAAGVSLRCLLVAAPRLDRLAELLGDLRPPPACPVLVAEPEVVEAIVGFDLHRGVVATATRPRLRDAAMVAARSRRVLVVEGISDTENLGALFRNAAALGAEGVLLDPTTADPWTRRVVRVSMGHVIGVPWARATLPGGIDALADAGFEVVGLSPDGDPIEPGAIPGPIPGDRRIALVVGAEGPGLSAPVRAAVERAVAIPMARGVDSLNVATAAAIGMWAMFGPAA